MFTVLESLAHSSLLKQLAPKRKVSKHGRSRKRIFVAGLFVCSIRSNKTEQGKKASILGEKNIAATESIWALSHAGSGATFARSRILLQVITTYLHIVLCRAVASCRVEGECLRRIY